MDIGERIRKLRTEAGISQETLGDQVGLTQASISRVETGKQQLRLVTLDKVAAALNITTTSLMEIGDA